jgi:protein arginine N-methyltransferase 1
MYSLSSYGKMLEDVVRRESYLEALRQTVEPGMTVLEIGTGPGVFALFACQFGARKVYAIEPDDSIQIGRELAAKQGCADRIQFIQNISTRVNLPEKVALVLSDLRGTLPLMQRHLPTIVDARKRFLAEGGELIPKSDRLWVSAVEAPDVYREHLSFWGCNHVGLNTEPALKIVANTLCRANLQASAIISVPQRWIDLDYRKIEEVSFGGRLTSVVTRGGTAHGLASWFDTELAEGVSFSTAPSSHESIYGQAFFPWMRPVEVAIGDVIDIEMHADLVDSDYIWRWNTVIREQGKNGNTLADFRQSSFFGIPLSVESLRKRASNCHPNLNELGQVTHAILDLMSKGVELGEIAARMLICFPDQFASQSEALARVANLSQKYSR